MPTNGYMAARALGERLKRLAAWFKRQPPPEDTRRSKPKPVEKKPGDDDVKIGPG